MDPFSLTVGTIGLVAAALQSARLCKTFIDSIIDGPPQLITARQDIIAYQDILSSIDAFGREHRFRATQECDVQRDQLVFQIMMGMDLMLSDGVETLGRVQELLQKFTKPSGEIMKVRVSTYFSRWVW